MQLQLLGLSDWNSDKLLRLTQRELEGALFPNEVHHGKDRESYQRFVTAYRETYGSDIHPVAAGGYFGMRLLLSALSAGAADREQVREFLVNELEGNAAQRMAEAGSLSILKVNSGKVQEFTAYMR
jgi:ABC-type branched-subunit amino acid transport system substrate-binding protein